MNERAWLVIKCIRNMQVDAHGKRLQVTASLGLTTLQPGDDKQSLFKRADNNLYKAKKQGRNRFVSDETLSTETPSIITPSDEFTTEAELEV